MGLRATARRVIGTRIHPVPTRLKTSIDDQVIARRRRRRVGRWGSMGRGRRRRACLRRRGRGSIGWCGRRCVRRRRSRRRRARWRGCGRRGHSAAEETGDDLSPAIDGRGKTEFIHECRAHIIYAHVACIGLATQYARAREHEWKVTCCTLTRIVTHWVGTPLMFCPSVIWSTLASVMCPVG